MKDQMYFLFFFFWQKNISLVCLNANLCWWDGACGHILSKENRKGWEEEDIEEGDADLFDDYSSVGEDAQAEQVRLNRIKQLGKKNVIGRSWAEYNGELAVRIFLLIKDKNKNIVFYSDLGPTILLIPNQHKYKNKWPIWLLCSSNMAINMIQVGLHAKYKIMKASNQYCVAIVKEQPWLSC